MRFNSDITIAIPVYERYEFFEDALMSAVDQTVRCNVIVVDNCSSHNLFEQCVLRLNLPHVTYHRNAQNLGAIGNWNTCINLPQTKWITILHSDDMLSLEYVDILSRSIDSKKEEICFMTRYEAEAHPNYIIKTVGKPFFRFLKIKKGYFIFGNPTAFPGVLFNKEILQGHHFVEELQTVADYDFWFKIAKIKPITLINIKLALYRVSEGQDSATAYRKVIRESYKYKVQQITGKNIFFKIIAMYELFYTYRYYKQKFDIVEKVYKPFEENEINVYFKIFERFNIKSCLDILFKSYRKSYLYISSLF
ncbi:MAG: glycosyltransferase [Pedobacter agri]